jgi:hypothetical protein
MRRIGCKIYAVAAFGRKSEENFALIATRFLDDVYGGNDKKTNPSSQA